MDTLSTSFSNSSPKCRTDLASRTSAPHLLRILPHLLASSTKSHTPTLAVLLLRRAQELSNNCTGSRHSAQIRPNMDDVGHCLATFGLSDRCFACADVHWSMLATFMSMPTELCPNRPKLTEIALANFGQLDLHVFAQIHRNLADVFCRTFWPTFATTLVRIGRLWSNLGRRRQRKNRSPPAGTVLASTAEIPGVRAPTSSQIKLTTSHAM